MSWWSTRLYLLASLAADLTSIRQLLFTRRVPATDEDLGTEPRVVGVATPEAVRARLIQNFRVLGDFEAEVKEGMHLPDVVDESRRRLETWHEFFQPRPRARPKGESGEKMWVREGLLQDWLGDYLIKGSVAVDAEAQLTAAQVQQILDWPWPYVPVVGLKLDRLSNVTQEDRSIAVVNRDAFARQIAQEWIARELPRNTAF